MYLKDKRRRQPSGKAVTLTMVITERLAQLRRSMAQRGMDGYVVVTDDFHGSEYVGDYFKARAYLSGFTGSAGTLVVLPDARPCGPMAATSCRRRISWRAAASS